MTKFYTLVFAIAALGCHGKDADKSKDDPAAQFVVDMARDEVPKLKAAVEKGDDGALISCAAALANQADLEKADADLAKTIEGLCWHDIPMSILKHTAEAVEAANAAKPNSMSGCIAASSVGTIKEDLAKHHNSGPEADAFVARIEKVCGKL